MGSVLRNLAYWGLDLALLGGGNLMPSWVPDAISWALLIAGMVMLVYGILGYFLRWPLAPRASRISLVELREMAKRKGWDFSTDKLEGMDFADGLRQAALDGTIRIWGRPNRNSVEALTRNEPLNEVARDHWKDYQLDAPRLYQAQDNFMTMTYSPSSPNWGIRGGFVDLHLNRREAAIWLRREAPQYKGRRDQVRGKG